MANEAVKLEEGWGRPVRFTCSDNVAIEKGALLKLSGDPFIVTNSAAEADVVAGIAATEKVANDGSSSIGVYVPGCGAIFDVKCGATAVTLGSLVRICGANIIGDAAAADNDDGKVLGKALETGTANEVIRVILTS
jgi:hypothetical protein